MLMVDNFSSYQGSYILHMVVRNHPFIIQRYFLCGGDANHTQTVQMVQRMEQMLPPSTALCTWRK